MTPAARAVRLLALAALLGCSDLADADGGIVALEVTVPARDTVTVGESLQLAARALDRDGQTVDAEIVWATPDPTIIDIDVETGLVTGLKAGTGRVQALSGSVASALVTIKVVDPPDPDPAPEALRRAP